MFLNSAIVLSPDGKKGAIVPGQLADLAVLSEDYFSMPQERIKRLESVLTLVGGKPVYATAEFKHLDPPPLAVSPDWSPVKHYGGYGSKRVQAAGSAFGASLSSACLVARRSRLLAHARALEPPRLRLLGVLSARTC